MNNKTRKICGIIMTALFLLNFFAQVASLIMVSNPKEFFSNINTNDGETAAVLLIMVVIGLFYMLADLFLSLVQCLGALIGRIPGTIISGVGLIFNGIFILIVTMSLAVFAGSEGITSAGAVLYFLTNFWMIFLSLVNFIFVLVEMCIYMGTRKKHKEE